MNKMFIILLCGLVGVSCTKKDFFEDPAPEIQGLPEATGDIKIPKEIWELLKTEEQATFEYSLAPLDVYLKEKNPGILKRPNYLVRMPRGGGNIDLAEYLSGEKGTFFVSLRPPENKESAEVTAYFIGRTKKRRIQGEVIGAGCRTFLEITKKFNREMLSKGLEVNTSDLRHASVLGGTFILKYVIDKKIYLTQTTFTDSRFAEGECVPGDEKE